MQGEGLEREAIVQAALAMLAEGGEQGLTMRGLASRLGVTPMSLYHHVGDRAGLLRALSEQVYGGVLPKAASRSKDHIRTLNKLLMRYYEAVGEHPQLTLALFNEPQAFAGVTMLITEQVTALLKAITPDAELWRDILVDHAHGSALALVSAQGDPSVRKHLQRRYAHALDGLLGCLAG